MSEDEKLKKIVDDMNTGKARYRIKWVAHLTGATGHGSAVFSDFKEAKKLADELNSGWAGVYCHHMVELILDPADEYQKSEGRGV